MRNIFVVLCVLAAPLAAQEKVRIYVSLDQDHSAPILEDFQKETGIEIDPEYDTERSKTVGLVRRLIAEKGRPQADVYWNNELATTIKLKLAGVLARYVSPSAADIPDRFKDSEGYWTGFAARARVLIVNTNLVGPNEMPDSMWDLADEKWRGKVAMAFPQTGTTAAHAAALYTKDPEEADRYFDALIENRVEWLASNGQTMRDVGQGRFAFAWTDTDDFNVALRRGWPVKCVFPDKGPDEIGVLYLPNSLMLIKGGPNPEAGKKLIDWLLRPEIEERLAHSATAQIPVRPGVKTPDNVKRPEEIGKTMDVDFKEVGRQYDRWTAHLREKFSDASTASGMLVWVVVGLVAAALVGFALLKKATGEPS